MLILSADFRQFSIFFTNWLSEFVISAFRQICRTYRVAVILFLPENKKNHNISSYRQKKRKKHFYRNFVRFYFKKIVHFIKILVKKIFVKLCWYKMKTFRDNINSQKILHEITTLRIIYFWSLFSYKFHQQLVEHFPFGIRYINK